MDDLSNIFKQQDDKPGDDALKNYISGNSTPEEQHALEMQMQESAFVSDAVEGLQQFNRKAELDTFVHHLNKNLQQQISDRKKVKHKRKLKDLSWVIIAVITILLLCILAFIVIRIQREHETSQQKNGIITMQTRPGKNVRES